jgi:DNA-binding transcriptional LysR family regulator
MEMHQVRYFLATVSELNFTKAAERCNVTQPSLTRAIKQLEDEFGGDLFRRERPQAQLTELGQRLYPLLKQCYESALGARSLAVAIKSGEVGTLKLALSRTISPELITSHLAELRRLFNRLELRLLRGTAPELVELLKTGEAELAVAGDLGDAWDRLDRWPLFSEEFGLIVNANHRLASRASIEIDDLRQERWLRRPYCEDAESTASLIRDHRLDLDQATSDLGTRPDRSSRSRPRRHLSST